MAHALRVPWSNPNCRTAIIEPSRIESFCGAEPTPKLDGTDSSAGLGASSLPRNLGSGQREEGHPTIFWSPWAVGEVWER